MDSHTAATPWLSETKGMLDPNNHQWDLSSLDHIIWDDLHQSLSSESYYFDLPTASITSNAHSCGSSIDSSYAEGAATPVERPKKIAKTSSMSILSFSNPSDERSDLCLAQLLTPEKALKRSHEAAPSAAGQVAKKAGSTHSSKDHILAERKRREKLSQKFIALSAIIPGLKKMDKASVLGDAIKYLKTLQEKVTAMEEQAARRTVESAVLVRKSCLLVGEEENEVSSSDENFRCSSVSRLPEIEAKLSGKSLLIKIHCESQKGLLARALSEIERLHLTVVSVSAAPFASSSLDMTVMAQIEEGFSMTVKDLVRKLSSAFRQFI